MPEQLFEEVLALFPSRGDMEDLAFKAWRLSIGNIFYALSLASSSERASAYEYAQERIKDADMRTRESMPLWIFSHPTFAVFERFIADTDICRSFADHCEYASISRWKLKKIRRRILKLMARKGLRENHLLGKRYAQLLEDSLKTDGSIRLLYRKNGAQHHMILVEEEYDVKSIETADTICEERTNHVIQEAVTEFRGKLLKHEWTDYRNIFLGELVPSRIEEDVLNLLMTEAILRIEIDDLTTSNHPKSAPLSGFAALVMPAIRNGTWVKFSTKKHLTTLTGARKVVVEWDQELLSSVMDTHTGSMIRMVHGLLRVEYGLLPVGLKIHCAGTDVPGRAFLTKRYFAAHNAGTCFVLPPVGSIRVAFEMLDVIGERAGVSYLDNPDYQIQVCCAGAFSPRNAALLGIAFYLGSDRIRWYEEDDFITNFAYETQGRLLIRGAGVLDTDFEWWGKEGKELAIQPTLYADSGARTDVLTCQSKRDIENVNLVATLLLHAQRKGYWEELGYEFIAEMRGILARHELLGLLDVSWIADPGRRTNESSPSFFSSLTELMTYARAEVDRMNSAWERQDYAHAMTGLLYEVKDLLDRYRTEIRVRSPIKGDE